MYIPEEEEKMVARALLPEEIAEGTKLHYEFMMYSVVELNLQAAPLIRHREEKDR